jgi:hypothetical protein
MDVGEVYALAEGFARALVANDDDVIASYLHGDDLADDTKGHLVGVHRLSDPSLQAEVQFAGPIGGEFNPAGADRFVTLTCFMGAREEVLVRATWVQEPHQLLIHALRIVDRRARMSPEGRAQKGHTKGSHLTTPGASSTQTDSD